MLTFVDANVFIRLFVEDDEQQRPLARKLLKQAQEGTIGLVTGPPVFFEVAWVLSYTYKIGNGQILDILEAVLSFPGLRVLDRELIISALSRARKTNATFADSYIAASVHHICADNLATFNRKHFKKLEIDLYPLDKLHEAI